MAKTKVKVGDEVVVIAGSQKGKSGTVITVNRIKEVVTVGGVNIRKKAVKPQGEQEGGIVEFDGPLHLSNVMNKEKYDSRQAKKA